MQYLILFNALIVIIARVTVIESVTLIVIVLLSGLWVTGLALLGISTVREKYSVKVKSDLSNIKDDEATAVIAQTKKVL